MDRESEIPWARFAAFVRRHTHDVRNDLNGLELETSLLHELAVDPEARASIARLRGQLRVVGGKMRALSAHLEPPKPFTSPIAANDLFLIWKDQQADTEGPLEVEWVNELNGELLVLADAGMMATVFRELLVNAAAFSQGGPVTATARREGDDVLFELREPKTGAVDTTNWGEPLFTTRRGGCGLGLWSVRRLLKANHARIVQRYVPEEGTLVSRMSLPVSK